MRILTIGDIHGRSNWKEVIDNNEFDLVIFLGDYVDSFHIKDNDILVNLLEIINYKKDNMDSTILLFGNHDLMYYFSYGTHGCSGYRSSMYVALHTLFWENRELFKASHQIGRYLWTHAGVTNGWYNDSIKLTLDEFGNSLSEQINNMFNSSKEWALSTVGYSRGGLRGDFGGPFWADESEIIHHPLQGYEQIVGHTPQRVAINTYGDFETKGYSYTFCDIMEKMAKGYLLEITNETKNDD